MGSSSTTHQTTGRCSTGPVAIVTVPTVQANQSIGVPEKSQQFCVSMTWSALNRTAAAMATAVLEHVPAVIRGAVPNVISSTARTHNAMDMATVRRVVLCVGLCDVIPQ